ncbi:MAG: pyrroloquinoline quinone precursor peptide PqqA [Devosia sp.]
MKQPSTVVAISLRHREEKIMAWNKPKLVEVPVSMEINMYFCATRK